jgi:hypothetical protein
MACRLVKHTDNSTLFRVSFVTAQNLTLTIMHVLYMEQSCNCDGNGKNFGVELYILFPVKVVYHVKRHQN